MDWTSGVFGLLGALIGAGAALGADIIRTAYSRRVEQRALARTLAATISSIIEMTEQLDYENLVMHWITALNNNQDFVIPDILGNGPVRDPFIDRTLDRVGLLHTNTTSDVIQFFIQLESIRMTLMSVSAGKYDGYPSDKVYILEEVLRLWEETKGLGQKLVRELRAQAK